MTIDNSPGAMCRHASDAPESLRTRLRLLEAGITLLESREVGSGLVEAAAREIGCPLERAHIYFGCDEDLVLALYLKLNTELAARVSDLPPTTIAERFAAMMQRKFAAAAPYKHALRAQLGTLLHARHPLGVLGSQTELVRITMVGVVATVVYGASDCPSRNAEAVAHSLYSIHLALMLFWMRDDTPDHGATRSALRRACGLLSTGHSLIPHDAVLAGLTAVDKIVGPLLRAETGSEASRLAEQVLRRLFRYRRMLPEAGACATSPCVRCFALHLPKLRRAIQAGERLHLLLPAFPAKSPSPRKVLGTLPDMAEEQALLFLQRICAEITQIYPPGVRLTICSDGHVFSDLVGVTDDDVTRYGAAVRDMIDSQQTHFLETFSMGDLYEGADYAAMRRHLCLHYAEPLEEIEARIHEHPQHQTHFNGIHRFLYEDTLGVETEKSKTQLRKDAKERAYQVIRRSDAWGRLLAECFPTALRLSIHPHGPHSDKIGILLGDADDAWLTPWHSVAVRLPDGFRLMPRQKAEELGAQPVAMHDRLYYYDLTELP
jgi:pyoverdine/dityrosine biosynthesis protein Dit1